MRSLSCAARARSTSFAIAQLASTMMMSPDVDSFRSVDASTYSMSSRSHRRRARTYDFFAIATRGGATGVARASDVAM
jgi:hypothetical protein